MISLRIQIIFMFCLFLLLVLVHCANNVNNRNIELFLKMKRLKQIKSEGKTYVDYLTEINRVKDVSSTSIDNNSPMKILNETEQINRMKKAVEYKSVNNAEKKIIFLPDVSYNENCRYFYQDLITNPKFCATILDMPNVYELNTKRYEVQWLKYMESLNLQSYHTIISHGSSSEALMRYLESFNLAASPSKVKKIIFIDAPDIYTAGERHGRRFLFNRITNNCKTVDVTFLVAQNNLKISNETNNLINEFFNYEHKLATYTQQDNITSTLLSYCK